MLPKETLIIKKDNVEKGIEDCTHEVKLILEIIYQEYIKDWAVFWNCLKCNTTGAIQERKAVKI